MIFHVNTVKFTVPEMGTICNRRIHMYIPQDSSFSENSRFFGKNIELSSLIKTLSYFVEFVCLAHVCVPQIPVMPGASCETIMWGSC